MRRTTAVQAAVLAAAIAVVVAGCAPAATTPGADEGGEPIHIGVIYSETGVASFAGVASKQAMEIAVERVNDQGGVSGRPLDLQFQDDATASDQTLALFGKFASDQDVVAIIGPTTTPGAAQLGPIATQRKIPLLSSTVFSNQPLTTGDWIFKTAGDPSAAAIALANAASDDLGLANVAVLFARDNGALVDLKDAFTDEFTSSGGTVTAVEVLYADTNFAAAAQKIVASNPDGVFLDVSAEAGANAAHQLAAAGLSKDVQLLGTTNAVAPDHLRIGGDLVDGTVAAVDYNPALSNEENDYFRSTYEERHGVSPDTYAAMGYQSVLMMVQALTNAEEISREGVQAALSEARTLTGVLGTGTTEFGTDRIPRYDPTLLELNGTTWGLFKP